MLHLAKNRAWLILLLGLIVADIFVFRLNFLDSDRKLTLAMLNVGQGDALYIESPTGRDILVDAGPMRKIEPELLRVMPLFDRSIDLVIITNPDSDHLAGLASLLDNYEVGAVLAPGTSNNTQIFQDVSEEIKAKNIPVLLARRGMRLNLGGGAYLDVLFPDRDVLGWSTNSGSIVARLVYGVTSVLLAGDATKETEKYILSSGENLTSTILKVGHHGSRSSTSADFLKMVSPRYAFISAGKDNKYGHPHLETLEKLKNIGAQILRTDLLGTVIMSSDGMQTDFRYLH